MKLTPGKLSGIKAVSNDRGVIAAAAMDQRGSLQKSLSKEKGTAISDEMMEEWKQNKVFYKKNNRTKQLLPQGEEFLSEVLKSDTEWDVEKEIKN